jgi:hypothetical protein
MNLNWYGLLWMWHDHSWEYAYTDHQNDSVIDKHFPLCKMAVLQWMQSVGALPDTPVAECCMDDAKTSHHVTYRQLISHSFCKLALAVSNLIRTFRYCGLALPHVRIGSSDMCFYPDFNAISDVVQSLLPFFLPVHKIQFSLYSFHRSFQVTRCMWLFTIQCSILPSTGLHLVGIGGILCPQAMMIPSETWRSYGCWCFCVLCTSLDGIQVSWAIRCRG